MNIIKTIGTIPLDKLFQKRNKVQICLSILTVIFFCSCKTVENNPANKNIICNSRFDSLTQKLVYPFVDEMPVYIDGDLSIVQYFSKNLEYFKQPQFIAKFELQFVIDEDGRLIGARIKNKEVAELSSMEKEIIRVAELMPKWKPGKCSGKKVPVLISCPINI